MFEEKELELNQPKRGLLHTVFRREDVEIHGLDEPELGRYRRKTLMDYIKFGHLKKLILIAVILAISLTILLIVKQITGREQTEVIPQGLSVDNSNQLRPQNSDKLETIIQESDVIRSEGISHESDAVFESGHSSTTIASTTSTTTTTTQSPATSSRPTTTTSPTTSTTESTTTEEPRKVLDHLSVSITINEASVPNKDAYVSKTDTYVKVYADEHFIGQTPVQKETLRPVWNYQIAHQMTLRPDSELRFELYDNDKYTSHEFIGKFLVKMSELIDSGSNGVRVDREHGSGRLWFTVSWTEVYRKA